MINTFAISLSRPENGPGTNELWLCPVILVEASDSGSPFSRSKASCSAHYQMLDTASTLDGDHQSCLNFSRSPASRFRSQSVESKPVGWLSVGSLPVGSLPVDSLLVGSLPIPLIPRLNGCSLILFDFDLPPPH